jgi:hypothetical protein
MWYDGLVAMSIDILQFHHQTSFQGWELSLYEEWGLHEEWGLVFRYNIKPAKTAQS